MSKRSYLTKTELRYACKLKDGGRLIFDSREILFGLFVSNNFWHLIYLFQCISGSSDGTIKLWSLGQQRCIATIYCHSEGVWALQTDDAFSKVYSSGRDRNVWVTDLRQVERRALVCRETAPVLRMIVTPDQKGLWLSTTESSVKWWNLSGLDYNSTNTSYHDPKSAASSELQRSGEVKKPEFVIPGGPSIKQCEILNDKRHILTKDTDNSVALYDVLKARKVEDLGQVDYDQEKERRSQVRLK